MPGARTHYLKGWKPLGTVSQRMRSLFVGGSPALADISYLRKPEGSAAPLSKFGFQVRPGPLCTDAIHRTETPDSNTGLEHWTGALDGIAED